MYTLLYIYIYTLLYIHSLSFDSPRNGTLEALATSNLEKRRSALGAFHYKPRPLEGRKEAEAMYGTLLKYGCDHGPRSRTGLAPPNQEHLRNKRNAHLRFPCICAQLFRVDGVAIIDQDWMEKTSHMRVGFDAMEGEDLIDFKRAEFKDCIEPAADCIRHFLHLMWVEFGVARSRANKSAALVSVGAGVPIEAALLAVSEPSPS
jgi:hypothetical protein